MLAEPVCCNFWALKSLCVVSVLADMLKGSFTLGRISPRHRVENRLNGRSKKLTVHLYLALGLI
jgi:hypothetical protein